MKHLIAALALGTALWVGWLLTHPREAITPAETSSPMSTARAAEDRPVINGAPPVSSPLASASGTQATPPATRSPDIYASAQQALAGNSPARLFDALRLSRECNAYIRNDDLLAFAGGASSPRVAGALTPERQMAIDALNKACGGYAKAGRQASALLIRQLKEKGAAIGAPEMAALESDQKVPGTQGLAALVFSESRLARSEATPLLLKYLRSVDVGGVSRPDLYGLGYALALCELGADCGAQAFATQLQCALLGRCVSTLWAHWEDGLDSAEVELVRRYKAQVLHGFQQGFLGAFVPQPPL